MAGPCHGPEKKGQDALRVFLRLRFAAPPEHPECVSQAEPLLQTDCCTTFDGADEIRNDLALVSPGILSTPSGSLPRTLKRRKEEANQGSYDCDDDEKFDQGEST